MNYHTESDPWPIQPKKRSYPWQNFKVISIISSFLIEKNDRTIIRIAISKIDSSIQCS